MNQQQLEGNYYDKYNTKNPIARILMNGFFRDLDDLLSEVHFDSLYEAGCGEGYVIEHIRNRFKTADLYASDLSQIAISDAKERVADFDFSVASIYDIPSPDNSYDLAMALEVFEHLEEPEKGLFEVLRISKEHIIVSVPNEPVWRISNMARGKYLSNFGNTPGHIQHWSPRKFRDFVRNQCDIICQKNPFPWTMLMCRKRS